MIAGAHGRALSTTASLLVVFLGVFVAMAPLYSATDGAGERVGDALADQHDRTVAVIDTDLNVTSASWDLTDSDLTLKIENTGDRTLDAARGDAVVDGTYVGYEDFDRVEIEGVDSDVWRPGEVLTLEDEDTVSNFLSTPDRVRVVSGPGVATSREVTSQ